MTKLLAILFVLWLSGGGAPQWNYKQIRWQRMSKLKSVGYKAVDYWLSEDPNHFCADLNFDEKINFYDYAMYLKLKD